MFSWHKYNGECLGNNRMAKCRGTNVSVDHPGPGHCTSWRMEHNFVKYYRQPHRSHQKQVYNSHCLLRGPHKRKKNRVTLFTNSVFCHLLLSKLIPSRVSSCFCYISKIYNKHRWFLDVLISALRFNIYVFLILSPWMTVSDFPNFFACPIIFLSFVFSTLIYMQSI